MGRLDGKVVIITGASSGIGRAAAILFAKERAKVVVACRSVEAGNEAVRMAKETGGEAIFVKTDVSKTEDVKNMTKVTVDTYGKLDVLYNNAGFIGASVPTIEVTEEDWEKIIGINLKGVWLTMKYAIPEMIKAGGGSIINTASQAADRGVPNMSGYSASKGGVNALTRATAIEYASQNIRVNSINPGTIMTPILANVLKHNPEAKKYFLSRIPLGRTGESEEVAPVALFLASDESSYMTGQTLVVDGGTSSSCF